MKLVEVLKDSFCKFEKNTGPKDGTKGPFCPGSRSLKEFGYPEGSSTRAPDKIEKSLSR